MLCLLLLFFFFFNDTATTEIYTLSLHDALPISTAWAGGKMSASPATTSVVALIPAISLEKSKSCFIASPILPRSRGQDRKSTRLNSSHGYISYAVFCLKKKK